jgi:hypothetical protein
LPAVQSVFMTVLFDRCQSESTHRHTSIRLVCRNSKTSTSNDILTSKDKSLGKGLGLLCLGSMLKAYQPCAIMYVVHAKLMKIAIWSHFSLIQHGRTGSTV